MHTQLLTDAMHTAGRMYRHSVAPEAIQKCRGTKYKLQAQKFLMLPSTLLWCPSTWEGTTKNRVGTTNSFLLVVCISSDICRKSWFLSHISTLTRVINIANLSVRLSVCSLRSGIRWKRLNISSVFSPHGSPIILPLPASNTFTKFGR